MRRATGVLAALLVAATPLPALAQPSPAGKSPAEMTPDEYATWKKANGSYYVQCDGQPDNMGGGEQAARIVGAITLLGLFAPAPEGADPAKRKFGADGVAACSMVIDGAKRESSPARRIGLILARGAHRIEAKDYAAARADAVLARATAAEAGLTDDPYWAASRGRGIDLLEAAALYRLDQPAEASAAALRNQTAARYSVLPLLGMPRYFEAVRTASPAETAYADAATRAYPYFGASAADRLEQQGRFADAAAQRDAVAEFQRTISPKSITSLFIAQAAVSHALAGHADRAAELARAAQANFDERKANGKPEASAAEFVEEMDLYGIIRTADAGDLKAARRLFAARSQWVAASFGSTLEVNRRLRDKAAPDELIGGLAGTPDELWSARAAEARASALAKDADNMTLFAMFPDAENARVYEAVAKAAWKTDKSPWLLKPKKPDPDATAFETLFGYGASPVVMSRAYMLHAALLAKARGQQGFVIVPVIASNLFASRILTGNRGQPGLPEPLFNDADAVIAQLSPVIPDPATLKARQAARAGR